MISLAACIIKPDRLQGLEIRDMNNPIIETVSNVALALTESRIDHVQGNTRLLHQLLTLLI